jgi:hypothetical protein
MLKDDLLPPFGLQRKRKTPERITIGKPLYFGSAEFVGQFSFAQRRVADRVSSWRAR